MNIVDSFYADVPHVLLYDTGVAGPSVCFTCCVHGNEKQGEILLEMFRTLYEHRIVCGKVFYVVANFEAYAANARSVSYDFNRIWNQPVESDSYEYYRMQQLQSIFDIVDVVLDFHTTSQNQEVLGVIDISCAEYSFFDAQIIMVDNSSQTGSMICYMIDNGKCGYGMELGTHDQANFIAGLHTMCNLLVLYGMMSDEYESPCDVVPLQFSIYADIVPRGEAFVFSDYIIPSGFTAVEPGCTYAQDEFGVYSNTTNEVLYVGLVSLSITKGISAGLLFRKCA